MTSVTRRTALVGSVAGLALVATEANATPSDPHTAWLAEIAENRRTIDAIGSELTHHEETLLSDMGAFKPRLTLGLPNGPEQFTSRSAISARRAQCSAEVRACLSHGAHLPGLDADAIRSNALAFWDKALEDFDAIQGRFDAHPSTAVVADCEAQENECWKREADLMYRIADTPAHTLEGIRAQLIVLECWTREGTPYRPGETPQQTDTVHEPSDREAFTLTARILESVAALSGADPRIRLGALFTEDINAGRVVPLERVA
ncbi:MAG: hypothetical protein RJS97_02810 [Parvibaculaceae bacterium]